MRVLRPVLSGSLVLSVAFSALAPSAGASQATTDAADWLKDQQEGDGGFELADFPPFETPDAALAIATEAQTTTVWSSQEARDAVEALVAGPDNLTALDFLDDYAESSDLTPGTAAKLVLLTALPFDFEPAAFDPSGDGSPVDLTADLGDIAPAVFNSYLFGRMADAAIGANVAQDDLQFICEAERPAGGWNFEGTSATGHDSDQDTTGLAVMALRTIGVPTTDPVLVSAGSFISGSHQTNGAWQTAAFPEFSSPAADDPNATALGMLGWTALGHTFSELPGGHTSPIAYLESIQDGIDGHIVSPNDFGNPNTFATSQALQALYLAEPNADWLPLPGASGRECLPAEGYSDVVATTWLENAARWVDAKDIISGIGGALQAGGPVSRAHAALWLNQMFDDVGGTPNTFPDVPDGAWYERGVDFVTSAPNGPIASGIGGQFRGQTTLTRGQAVGWLYAAAGSPDVTGLPATGFTDQRPWFANAAIWAKANGIVTGFGDSTFRPSLQVTRGQFASWLYNLAASPEAWEVGSTLPSTILFQPPV